MRVLVCGGRDYTDLVKVHRILDEYLISCIIHGAARGADTLAGKYAYFHSIPTEVYPAEWDKYGKSAGYIRNKQMLDKGKPDLVVAFPGGKGTNMMCDLAKKANVPVHRVDS